MECENVDKIKPLDKLFEDQIREFESGGDKDCDKDLDAMIGEFGDYENEELPVTARELGEENPLEENLVEKKMVSGRKDKPRLVEGGLAQEEIRAGENVAAAHSISPETRRRRGSAVRGYQSIASAGRGRSGRRQSP